MLIGLSADDSEQKTVMIDATYLKAHCTASSLETKRGRSGLIGRTKGDMKSKLHAIRDSLERPLNVFGKAGQVSDYIGARAFVGGPPKVKWLLGDRGYDADRFREASNQKGYAPAYPVANNARQQSEMKSAGTNRAIGSSSCSAGSRFGGV